MLTLQLPDTKTVPKLSLPPLPLSLSLAPSLSRAWYQIVYNMQNIFNLLPNLNVDELVRSMLVKTNDMHLVIYVSALIRSVVALHDLVNNKVTFLFCCMRMCVCFVYVMAVVVVVLWLSLPRRALFLKFLALRANIRAVFKHLLSACCRLLDRGRAPGVSCVPRTRAQPSVP